MAKRSQFTHSILISIIIVGIMGLGQGPSPVQAQQCPGLDLGALKRNCYIYVVKLLPKMRPSTRCCGVVRSLNVPCLCKYVNKEVERVVSATKALYVSQYCGLALPHGNQCGSYTIP